MEAIARNLSLPHEASVNKVLQFVGLEFTGGNKQLGDVLGKEINAIERRMLS